MIACIAERCQQAEAGARNIDHLLTRSLLPEISTQFLTAMVEGKILKSLHVKIAENGELLYQAC